FKRRRSGLETVVVLFEIYKKGIGDEAFPIPAFGLPGGPFVERFGLSDDEIRHADGARGGKTVETDPAVFDPVTVVPVTLARKTAGDFDLLPRGTGGESRPFGLPVTFARLVGSDGKCDSHLRLASFDAGGDAIGG